MHDVQLKGVKRTEKATVWSFKVTSNTQHITEAIKTNVAQVPKTPAVLEQHEDSAFL